MYFFTQKDHPAPQKLIVLHEKKCRFLLKKTIQPRKKLKLCIKKLTKKLPKRAPSPAKTSCFACKIENRPTYGDFEKKILDPQLHQIFKPIRKFFCTFLPI